MATLVQGENRIPRPGIDSASAVLPNFAIGKRLYNKVRLVLPAFGFQQGQILVGVVRRCSQVNHLETGPQTRLEDFSHSILRQNVKAIDEGSAKTTILERFSGLRYGRSRPRKPWALYCTVCGSRRRPPALRTLESTPTLAT